MTKPTQPDSVDRDPHGLVSAGILDEHIWVMTVDRTEKTNALTPKITRELAEAFTRLDEDDTLWVGVLRFAGDHSTAGIDMPLFFGQNAAPNDPADSDLVDPYGLRRRLRKPLVVAIQGITYTAGIEIALAGDIIVAASDTELCQLEPKRGLAAIGGGTIRYVQRAGWGNAMYHLLRADRFDAAEAHRIGLVQEVVEPGTQWNRAVEIAREISRCAPLGLIHTIANARLAITDGETAAFRALPAMAQALTETSDFREGIASFTERRDANFAGR